VVDDDAGLRFMLRDALSTAGLEVDEAKDGQEAFERIAAGGYHLVLTDLRMPRLDGLGLLRKLRELPGAPRAILITAHGSEQHVVEALRLGVFDYLRKPCPVAELLGVVARATEQVRLQMENERLTAELALSDGIAFRSAPMRELGVLVARVAPRDVTVLITGESGTGKEHIAEAIVRGSGRAEKPFVRFNCAALTPELAEAELFGHSRGAFTGAARARPGLFREADGGTLLLDEVGELQLALQAKLLRVLQEGEVRPVGEEIPSKVDVRVLASTHRDLEAMVAGGVFRQGPLLPAERRAPARPAAARAPGGHPLPGRAVLRPLLASVRRRVVASDAGDDRGARGALVAGQRARAGEHGRAPAGALRRGDARSRAHRPCRRRVAEELAGGGTLRQQLQAVERNLIVEAMTHARGNQAEASRALGIGRATLHDKLRRFGL
jgi:two-component system response regulator HydG